MQRNISEDIRYIGVDDTALDLFENQYTVPQGISYNSYVILDETVAVLDTVDKRCCEEWERNLLEALKGRKVDFLVIHHLEPDHAGSIARLVELFPDVVLVGNAGTFAMLPAFFELAAQEHSLVVKEGDKLALGRHYLTFYMAPMVHWPEVMVSYETSEKLLFSADAFGRFGALGLTKNMGWVSEARRYYFNIAGKYAAAVRKLLQKMITLDIQGICPLHGPVLREGLEKYIHLYDIWSSLQPENKGVVIVYGSMHGNTAQAAAWLAERLSEKQCRVRLYDLARADFSKVIEEVFRYDKVVFAAASYDGGVFSAMEDFLHHLKSKGFQNRKAALIENGAWRPTAAKTMYHILSTMKNIEFLEPVITIHAVLKERDLEVLDQLADVLVQ